MAPIERSFDDPIPRDVYEQLTREGVEYIDFWRGETLKAEAEVKRLRDCLERIASGNPYSPEVVAQEALDG